MTPAAILTVARSRGVVVGLGVDGKLSVRWPDEATAVDLRPHLAAAKAEVVDLLRAQQGERVAFMRAQVPPGGPIPFLIARPRAELSGLPGRCASCDDRLADGAARGGRCVPCAEAARLAGLGGAL